MTARPLPAEAEAARDRGERARLIRMTTAAIHAPTGAKKTAGAEIAASDQDWLLGSATVCR
jgi:hypothetical protein